MSVVLEGVNVCQYIEHQAVGTNGVNQVRLITAVGPKRKLRSKAELPMPMDIREISNLWKIN